MWTRSGTYFGRPAPGKEEAFIQGITDELIPAMLRLPGVTAARLLWPRSSEDTEIEIFCQMFIDFEEEADLERMLTSPEREQVRITRDRLLPMFEGRIEHMNFEVA